MQNRLILN